MKTLKTFGAAIALTFVFGLPVLAGDVPTPPCAPPEPGEMSAPPCAAIQITPDNPTAPGQIETPAASNGVDIVSVVEAAVNLLLIF